MVQREVLNLRLVQCFAVNIVLRSGSDHLHVPQRQSAGFGSNDPCQINSNMVPGCCNWSTSPSSSILNFPAKNPRRATLKRQVPVWPVLVNGGAAKRPPACSAFFISDDLDEHRPDIQSDEGERAEIHPVRMHFHSE